MNQSELIREAISGATIKPTIVATLVSDDLLAAIGKLTAEYGRIGNNLNQIARHLNEWRSPYPAMAKELQDATADLATLKFEVMKKVGDAVGNVQVKVVAFWCNFAKNGDPNGPDLPVWTPYTSASPRSMVLDINAFNMTDLAAENIGFAFLRDKLIEKLKNN